MTEAQRAYLETLAGEAGEPAQANLTKAQASERIDAFRAGRARGQSRPAAPGDGGALRRVAESLDRIAECLERIEGFLARSADARREHGGQPFRPGRRPGEGRREYGRDSGYQGRRGDQSGGPRGPYGQRDQFGGQRDRPGRRRWERGEGNR
jgi:hypothetical protein